MSRDELMTMRGAWDVRHWISVPGLSSAAAGDKLVQALSGEEGIQCALAYPGKHKIRVTYDQTKTDYVQILAKLEALEFPAASGWWARKKGAWFQYLDQNARVNAGLPASPCCSNPTQILNRNNRRR